MKLKKSVTGIAAFSLTLTALTIPAMAFDVNETIDNNESDATYQSFTASHSTEGMAVEDGGKFRIEYTGDEATIVLVLSDWTGTGDHSWVAVSVASAAGTTESGYYVEYDYDKIAAAWGGNNFSNLKGICASTWGRWDSTLNEAVMTTSTITSIDWIAPQTDGYRSADGRITKEETELNAPYWQFTTNTPNDVRVSFKSGETVKTAEVSFDTVITGESDVSFVIFAENAPDDIKAKLD